MPLMAVPSAELSSTTPRPGERVLPERWTPTDAPKIAEVLGYQYGSQFQEQFEMLLENKSFQGWVSNNRDPFKLAETYFSSFGPAELPRVPASQQL